MSNTIEADVTDGTAEALDLVGPLRFETFYAEEFYPIILGHGFEAVGIGLPALRS